MEEENNKEEKGEEEDQPRKGEEEEATWKKMDEKRNFPRRKSVYQREQDEPYFSAGRAPGALGECEPHEPGSLDSHVLRHDFEVTETDPSITDGRGMSCHVTRH